MELLNKGYEHQYNERNKEYHDKKEEKFIGVSEIVSADDPSFECSTQIPRNLHIIKHIEIPEKFNQIEDEEEEEINENRFLSKGNYGTISIVFSIFAFCSVLLGIRMFL